MKRLRYDLATGTDGVPAGAIRRPQRPGVGGIILLLANLVPLVGVVAWGWDAFLLLTLYWMETVVIAGWTIARIAWPGTWPGAMPPASDPKAKPLMLAGFFTFHAGLFIAVHFLFLWLLFSGDWGERAGGVFGFFREAIVNEGLWVPLLILFVARGVITFGDVLMRALRRLAPALFGRAVASAPPSKATTDGLIAGLYGRIVAMQFAIILGAWVAVALGSVGPLVLLIAAKTLVELFWTEGPMLKAKTKPPAAILRDGRPNEAIE